mgnify:FL=1
MSCLLQHIHATEYGSRPQVGKLPAIFFYIGNILTKEVQKNA